MCGIAGYLRLDGPAPDAGLLRRMTDALAHRGPDAEGLAYWDDPAACRLALGHRRLSITDPSSASDEPFFSADRRIAVVFNGQIHNYRELRGELESRGHAFRTRGDVEVAARAYEEFGPSCFERFNGMWALALWDGRHGRLLLCRDRFGIKPLYVREGRGLLAFASEPRALLTDSPAEPDLAALANHLVHSFHFRAEGEESFFAGIRQLPPAHRLLVGLDGKRDLARYWDLPTGEAAALSDDEAAQRLRSGFDEAVRLRLPEGLEAGIMLSGGLDSGAVASSARAAAPGFPLRAYCVSNANRDVDETAGIRANAAHIGLETRFVSMAVQDPLALLAEVVEKTGEPIPNDPALGTWLVMRQAAAEGVRVMLTGDAGDELLAGYYQNLYRPYHLRDLNDEEGDPRAWEAGRLTEERERARDMLSDELMAHLPSAVSAPAPRGRNLRTRLRESLTRGSLPKCLRFLDRASMAFSIEARPPLLDHRLVEYIFSLPGDMLIRGGVYKWVQRRALRGRLPEAALGMLEKRRMLPPDLSHADLRRMEELVLGGAFARDCLKPEGVRELIRLAREDAGRQAIRFWPLAGAAVWYDSCLSRR